MLSVVQLTEKFESTKKVGRALPNDTRRNKKVLKDYSGKSSDKYFNND
jgi:hypothetical protein